MVALAAVIKVLTQTLPSATLSKPLKICLCKCDSNIAFTSAVKDFTMLLIVLYTLLSNLKTQKVNEPALSVFENHSASLGSGFARGMTPGVLTEITYACYSVYRCKLHRLNPCLATSL